jgi:DNA repair exonuclease SbcCD nuclease subunit
VNADLRILLLADSHLGLDLPLRPRVDRPRRGHDFIANYHAALEPAFAGEVDIVVHAGDVFDRPRVAESVAWKAFEPLRRLADRGVPVFIVPGNHERSRLPHARLAVHERIHVFDRPRTYALEIRGTRLLLAGFPYERRRVRRRFTELIEQSGWKHEQDALSILCIHHSVEGATVGPGDFTFTTAADVIRTKDIPHDFAAVFSGHIHRHQVLTRDLQNRALNVPVLYPGSLERTALAEIGETKGYLMVNFDVEERRARWEFRKLHTRPMLAKKVQAEGLTPLRLEAAVRALIAAAPEDAVLSIRIEGELSDAHLRKLSAAQLRSLCPKR